jgi:hypothetical protein
VPGGILRRKLVNRDSDGDNNSDGDVDSDSDDIASGHDGIYSVSVVLDR